MINIIAVDFDGCLCTNMWPEVGEPNKAAIAELKKRKSEGWKIILWTCRCGDALDKAVDACLEWGIELDAINDNLPEMKEMFGNDCRKVSATEYWDDRAVCVQYGGRDESN